MTPATKSAAVSDHFFDRGSPLRRDRPPVALKGRLARRRATCRQPHKPAKAKSTERIDGIVAAIMAIGRAMVAQEQPQPEYSMFFV